jgi:hypothetical protein
MLAINCCDLAPCSAYSLLGDATGWVELAANSCSRYY